jgi:hypothetical protein
LTRIWYDLTILRIRFRRLRLKIYTKGERVLREARAHNARDLGCRLSVSYFPEAVAELRQMVERFVEVLDCLDTTFIDPGLFDQLSQPGRLGAVRVGGIDLSRPRAPCRHSGPPRALAEPGGVHGLGARHEDRPPPGGRTVLDEPRCLRPQEGPLQGLGRQVRGRISGLSFLQTQHNGYKSP